MIPVVGKVRFNKRGEPVGVGRFVKSADYKNFETRCTSWEIAHKSGLGALKAEIIKRRQELAKQNLKLTLRVDFYAVFPKSKLFSSTGEIEMIDSDNRIKPAKDLLFRMLNVDDKIVFADTIEKIHGSKEYMIIKLSEYLPRSEKDILLSFGIK